MATPFASSMLMSLLTGSPLVEGTKYRNIVSKLQYLNLTRSDIAFIVNCICQYMHRPIFDHWSLVKSIPQTQSTLSLTLPSSPCFIWFAYLDSYWASCLDHRKSTPILLRSLVPILSCGAKKKKETVARASMEVEYEVVSTTVVKLTLQQSLLMELAVPFFTFPTAW